MMKVLAKDFIIKLVRYFSPLLRNSHILNLVKKMPPGVSKKFLEHNLDPNTIRKGKSLNFPQKLVIVNWASSKMLVDLNDHIGYRYFLKEKFDDLAIQIGKKISIGKNDIFLDIGANIGTVGIPLAKSFQCKCIFVEASLMNASLLCQNVSANKIESIILIGCVSNSKIALKNEFVKLYRPSGNSGASSVNKNWNTKGKLINFEYAKVYTLDTLISDTNLKKIKMIKLDIEGHELEALSGFKKIYKSHAILIFEYRLDLMNKISKTYAAKLLKEIKKNFEIFTIDYIENDVKLIKFDSRISQNNVIGIPKSKLEYYLKKFQ